MSYTINTYDPAKALIASTPTHDDLGQAEAEVQFQAAKLDEGGEAHLVAKIGGGQKWLLGYRRMDGRSRRLTPELIAQMERAT